MIHTLIIHLIYLLHLLLYNLRMILFQVIATWKSQNQKAVDCLVIVLPVTEVLHEEAVVSLAVEVLPEEVLLVGTAHHARAVSSVEEVLPVAAHHAQAVSSVEEVLPVAAHQEEVLPAVEEVLPAAVPVASFSSVI